MEDDAPATGTRAIFLVDILNPCWLYKAADLDGVKSISASVGQIPVNFIVGAEKDMTEREKPGQPDGELIVRLDSCTGPTIAILGLRPALANPAISTLTAPSLGQHGIHDLCLTFATANQTPMWMIDSITLDTESAKIR